MLPLRWVALVLRVYSDANVLIQCTLGPEQVRNLTNALDSLQDWEQGVREQRSAEYVNYIGLS
jgi:hypothetical protein